MTKPSPSDPEREPTSEGLRLRPIAHEPDPFEEIARPPSPLHVRPVAPHHDPASGLDPLDEELARRKLDPKYNVLDPDHREQMQERAFHLNPHYETWFARFVSRVLRPIRDWLYVISLGFLAAALWGYALGITKLLHMGASGAIVVNAWMLGVGLFYLVTLPFKDSLAKGLGSVLFPPYAVYYWVTNWSKMRGPVIKTAKSFTPIVIAAVAVFLYKEAPVIQKAADQAIEKVEETFKNDPEPPDTGSRPSQAP